MRVITTAIEILGKALLRFIEETGKIILLFLSVLSWLVRPPLKFGYIFKQMEFVG